MPDRRLALWLLAAVAYALLSHGLMLYAAEQPWAVAALFAPGLTALAGIALAKGRWAWLGWVGLAGAALALVSWLGGVGSVNRLYLAQHAGIHLALAGSFAYTLRRGAVPMISAFALRVHANGLTPDMWRYTRKLTALWTAYFVMMAAASVLIYLALNWAAWSFFANLLTPLSALLLFGGEHLVRYRLHPEFERANWRQALNASMRPGTVDAPVPEAGGASVNRPLPLLANADLDATVAWVDGEAVSAARFLAETLALAERLPAEGEVVNFCNDRYLFSLGFAAALCRGLGSLFPPNARPETLSLLADAAVARTVLVDVADIDTGGLPKLLITRPSPAELARERPLIDGDLVAACLLTSGSTGVPQPHAKRWQTLVLNIAAEAERLAAMLGRSDLIGLTLVATVPPQHSYGFESSVLLALLGGATFDSGRPFYPADIAAALARVPRPRALVTTPFHLKTLLQSGVAVPPVDLILSATAPLSPQLAAEAERVMGGALIEIYGCTEAGQVASRRTTEGDVWQTLGELRVYRAVADAGDGHDIPAAAQAPEATEVFMVAGGHVAEPTPLADLLEIHDERHFRLLGRANDLIHVAGRRSSLAHLNFHLNRIDGIEDGCFWLPDEDGEVVARTVAFVVSRTLSARQVVAALRPHVDGIFLPRRVVFVDALPREATGKLTAQTLRHFAAAQLKSAEPAADAAEAAAPPAEVRVPCRIDANHPAFDGHFPGQPVLPGVVLLSEVLAAALGTPAISDRLGPCPVFDSAKFLAPVGPGCDLMVVLVERPGSQPAWQFEVRQGERVMARGVLRAGAPLGGAS